MRSMFCCIVTRVVSWRASDCKKSAHVRFERNDLTLDIHQTIIHRGQLSLNRFHVLKQEFVCYVISHSLHALAVVTSLYSVAQHRLPALLRRQLSSVFLLRNRALKLWPYFSAAQGFKHLARLPQGNQSLFNKSNQFVSSLVHLSASFLLFEPSCDKNSRLSSQRRITSTIGVAILALTAPSSGQAQGVPIFDSQH